MFHIIVETLRATSLPSTNKRINKLTTWFESLEIPAGLVLSLCPFLQAFHQQFEQLLPGAFNHLRALARDGQPKFRFWGDFLPN